MKFRIRELKSNLNKSNKQIADDLKVSPHTVNSWLSGKRTPRPSQIMTIENIYGLNPGWLSEQKDNMYPDSETNSRIKQVKEIMTCKSDFAIKTVCKLAEATDSEWETLEKILK